MTIASIVPIRRLLKSTTVFDYAWPDDQPLVPGSIVRLPFGHESVLGVVWGKGQYTKKLARLYKPIQGVVSAFAVLSPWQMDVLRRFAAAYSYSLSSLVESALPVQPERLTAPAPKATSANRSRQSHLLWYRQRREMEEYLIEWLSKPGVRLLLVPTIEEAEGWGQRFPAAVVVHGRLTPKRYSIAYQAVLSGQSGTIIGTSKALFLPFRRAPEILIDQEEHRAYRQVKGRPLFDIVRAIDRLHLPHSRSTPAPRLRTFAQVPARPRAAVIHRHLGTLGVPGQPLWVSPELGSLLSDQSSASVSYIFPGRGYAGSLLCGDCGHVVRCPKCHRAIRLWRQDATHTRCQACSTLSPLPTRCPRCQGYHWKYVGLRPERWPDLLAGAHLPHEQRGGLSGGYELIQQLASIPIPRVIVFPSADALLSSADYATSEHAWQYIARLSSLCGPDDHLLMQTFDPQNQFWQRWLNGEVAAWYTAAIEERRKFGLPPNVDQWIVQWPGQDAAKALRSVQAAIVAHRWPVQLQPLLDTGTNRRRWAVKETRAGALARLSPGVLFPSPWRVDIDSDTWLP